MKHCKDVALVAILLVAFSVSLCTSILSRLFLIDLQSSNKRCVPRYCTFGVDILSFVWFVHTRTKMTAAFVPVGGVHLTTSSFTGGSEVCKKRPASMTPTTTITTTMRVLDGLDTVTQQPYTFSRYILGPFQGTTISANSSEEERSTTMAIIYRQVFANAYIMEEERCELAKAESQFKMGNLSVKEFVRCLAKSYAYKSRFFENSSNYRFIEMNHMHLLGRAPDNFDEMRAHNATAQDMGYDAEIDSYIDSDEYNTVFGDDTVPFLRFRGAYTPCDSFNKQCALKGGWANSDKAMGGAALSGYNGSDGRQMSTMISSHISNSKTATPYEAVAANTPLRTTAPNWFSLPDPAVPPTPAYVSPTEVAALQKKVADLQAKYDAEISGSSSNPLEPFRAMTRELAPLLDRGFAFSGGDASLANPYAKLMDAQEGTLAAGGQKSSDYKRYLSGMENSTVSRLERDLELAKSDLRVLEKALASSSPMTPQNVNLPGQSDAAAAVASLGAGTVKRPVVIASRPRENSSVGNDVDEESALEKIKKLNPFYKK